jgi:hypothetical protein
MTKDIAIADEVPFPGADWFDPLEAGIRQHIRGFIEKLLEEEFAATLRRGRYDRSTAAAGHRNGHRDRQKQWMALRPVTDVGPFRCRVPGRSACLVPVVPERPTRQPSAAASRVGVRRQNPTIAFRALGESHRSPALC